MSVRVLCIIIIKSDLGNTGRCRTAPLSGIALIVTLGAWIRVFGTLRRVQVMIA